MYSINFLILSTYSKASSTLISLFFFFLYFVNSECLCMQKGTGSACSVLQMQHAEAKQIEILTNLHFISLIRSLTSSPAQLQYHSLDFGPGIFQRSAKHLDNFIILHKQYTKKKNTFVYYPVYNTENKWSEKWLEMKRND